MKKFTFMLLAAFIAACAWAQPTAEKNRLQLPEQLAVSAKSYKLVPEKKEMAPRTPLKGKVQAPVKNTNSKKAKSVRKKAFDFSVLLSGEPETFLIKSYSFSMKNVGTTEEPEYDLVPNNISRVSEFWTITLDATTMEISITGIGEGDLPVKGVVNPQTMEITIPYGQDVNTLTNGTKAMFSATGADNLVCTLGENGIEFGDYWYLAYVGGDNDGYMASDIYLSEAVQPNGKMTFGNYEAVIYVEVDKEYYIATVWNFADEGVAVDVTLKPEGKFIIEPQLIYEGGSTYGDFYTYDSDWKSLISGTGTENTLTFANTWTICAPSTGYWFGEQPAATITFDGTFVYPELSEAPATPANPEVTFFDFWNGEYATVTVTVPCVDAEGNDIKGSLLTYQLYTKDGEGNAVALGEPIAYDNAENGTGDTKTVKLGEEAKNLTIIGAKSIYTASGETNESEIAWFEIPQLVVVPEGVEVTEYPVISSGYYGSVTGWQDYEATVLLGVDGTDVYVQGILPQCPNGWAKGTLENGVVTFPVQCVGIYNSTYIYLAAYGDAPSPVTFTYDPVMDMYVSEDYILANSYTDAFSFYYPYFNGMTIGEEDLVGDFTFDFNTMNVPTSSNVTTDGDITENFEIVKGNATLTISPKDEGATTANNRFWSTNAGPQLRVYSGTLTFTVPKGYNITGITFNYAKWNAGNAANAGTITDDATNKVATWEGAAQTVVVTIAANTQINNIVVTVEEAPEVAATPATPAITNLKLTGTNYPALGFSIPTVDTNDYPMNVDKLYYTIWYELDEGEAQQFTIIAEEYQYVEEDLVEVPYTYNDEWDIYEGGAMFYLNPADFDYTLWKRIGVQSIYYGADERNASEIAWIDNPVYSIPVTVTEALYATFVAPVDVDFTYSGAEAFTAVINPETGNATLIPVSKVPAGTAVVVKAEEAGTYRVNQTTEATLEVVNELVAATEPVVADGTQYILAKEGEEVGFYQVTPETTIAAGKGYLVVEAAVKSFYPIEEGNATGIETVDSQLTTDNNPIYNLAGQRISKIQKGISIVNGKKILK